MDFLFFRVYLKLFVCMTTAFILTALIVMPRIRAQSERNFEESLAPTVGLAAEMLADRHDEGRDLHATFERAVAHFHDPAALVPRTGLVLGKGDLERLDRGEVVLSYRMLRVMALAPIRGTDQILKIGPVNSIAPMSGGRGVAIILLFIGGLSLGVYLIVNPIRTRLARLARAAEAVGRGELSARAEPGSRDEIGSLATSFNRMADEIQRLIAAQEELLRMTSHELRTPLQRMHFNLEGLRELTEAEPRERELDRMERDLGELDNLIEELLSYVRLREDVSPVLTPIDVCPVIAELCETLLDRKGEITLRSRLAVPGPIAMRVEVRLVRRAVANLIVNALRYARSRVEITVEREGQSIWISVDDDGPGIPPAARERIFEPFQRLEDERTRSTRGSGLGLAIVRRIADMHQGSITVLTSDLGGARFRLSLPRGD